MSEAQILRQFAAIKEAFTRVKCKVGKRYAKWQWKVRTPGWRYTLAWNDGWQLEPVNTSPRYQQLFVLMGEAIAKVGSDHDQEISV